MTFEYRHVAVVRVIDGDTIELELDLGNKTRWRDKFRLNGIDTPERGQSGYAEAALYLRSLLGEGAARAVTHKPDKYGRYLVDLYVKGDQGGERSINYLMVLNGHAREYDGGKKTKPVS